MSTFGKILAVFNVLAAIGFLVVASMDYGRQHSWAYSEYRHRLALTGLPVDAEELDTQEPDQELPVVARLTPGVLKDVFQGNDGGSNDLGGPEVKTVLEELERVRQKVTANVNAETDPAKQKQLLKYYLLGLSKTSGERESLRKIVDGDGGIVKGLAEVDTRFNDAKVNAKLGVANRAELRAKIAHVLVNVNPTEPWRKRVMVVVGMEAYIDALNRQADSLASMFANIQQLIATDQAAFERHHADLVQVILKESDELHKAKVFLDDLTKTAAERKQQVALRQTEKNKYDARLAQARGESQSEVAKLNAIQKDLFGLQQKLVLAMQRNQTLEGELRSLEQNSKR